MQVQLFDIINIIAVFELVLFSAFLLVRNFHSWPNRLLALFLLAQAADCINAVIDHQVLFFIDWNPHIFNLGFPAHLIIPPAIYLYFVSIQEVPLRRLFLKTFHFLPAFSIFLYLFFRFYIQPVDVKLTIMRAGGVFTLTQIKMFFGVVFLQTFIYIVQTHRLIVKNRDGSLVHKQHFFRINWQWVRIFFYGYGILCLVAFVVYLKAIIGNPFPPEITLLIIYGSFFGFYTLILFKAWLEPDIFSGKFELHAASKNKLTPEQLEAIEKHISKKMISDELYLDPLLSLRDLSRYVKVPYWEVSRAINFIQHMNFFDYVNRFRIEKATKLIKQSVETKQNFLEILYDVGFNSKSSFNSAFKKQMGMTPSEYKKKVM